MNWKDLINEEEVTEAIKKEMMNNIVSAVKYNIVQDYVKEVSDIVKKELQEDEEFKAEIAKIRHVLNSKLKEMMLEQLEEVIKTLKVDVRTWELSKALKDGILINFGGK